MSTKRQGGWLFASSAVAGIVQLCVFSMLAYYTSPEVIGVLAIVNIFLAIAFVIQDMGLSNYFIYRQDLTKPESSTLYFTNCFLGIMAGLLIAIVANPVGHFYGSVDITISLYIMAFNFFLLGLSAQYQANLIKSQRNIALAKVDIFIKLLLFIATFLLIKAGVPSVFPYLYAYLFVNLVKFVCFLVIADKSWHPSLTVDTTIIKPAMRFGGYQMGSQIVSQVRTQLDQLIIGKLMGMELLGIYSFAKELIMQPVKFIRILIGRIVFPQFAKLQNSELSFNNLFGKSIKLLAIINTLLYIMFVGFVVVVIELFFTQYVASIPLLFSLLILGLAIPFGSLLSVSTQAKGNTQLEFQWNLISALISVLVVACLAYSHDLIVFTFGMAALQMFITAAGFVFYSKVHTALPNKVYFSALLFVIFIYSIINILYYLFMF